MNGSEAASGGENVLAALPFQSWPNTCGRGFLTEGWPYGMVVGQHDFHSTSRRPLIRGIMESCRNAQAQSVTLWKLHAGS
jgi:hypothetical protein